MIIVADVDASCRGPQVPPRAGGANSRWAATQIYVRMERCRTRYLLPLPLLRFDRLAIFLSSRAEAVAQSHM